MFGRRIILGFVAASLLAVLLVGQSLSQSEGRQERRGGRPPATERSGEQRQQQTRGQRAERPGGQRMGLEQMQRMMIERLKERLEAGEEKWKVIEPRMTKVLTLSRQARGISGLGMLFRGRTDRGGQTQERPRTREQTEVEKRTEELMKLLENKDAKPEEIKKMLTALREAQEKAKRELAKAEQELREVLTVRQEAQLVLMGVLN